MIQGILFDSGGVLIRPVGGRWNPRYDFEEIEAFPLAVEEIDEVLEGVKGILDDGIKDILVFYYPRDWRVRVFAYNLVFACLLIPVGTEARTGLVCIAVLATLMLPFSVTQP